jgi:translation initiation factor 3 subunit B
MDYDEETDFSDPEDFVDDISDEELMPEIMKQEPNESDGVDSVIVVDNIPSVGAERTEKLKNVIRQIY